MPGELQMLASRLMCSPLDQVRLHGAFIPHLKRMCDEHAARHRLKPLAVGLSWLHRPAPIRVESAENAPDFAALDFGDYCKCLMDLLFETTCSNPVGL